MRLRYVALVIVGLVLMGLTVGGLLGGLIIGYILGALSVMIAWAINLSVHPDTREKYPY